MEKLTGHGRPGAHFRGEVGQHYEDLDTGDIYECRVANQWSALHGKPLGGYVWERRAKGEDVQELFGSGGGADWNASEGEPGYIQNRTHYTITQEYIIFDGDVTITTSSDRSYIALNNYQLAEQQILNDNQSMDHKPIFTVWVNGIEYFGYSRILGGSSFGIGVGYNYEEPKYTITMPSGPYQGHFITHDVYATEDTTYTVKVIGHTIGYKPIPIEYMPFVIVPDTGSYLDYKNVADAVEKYGYNIWFGGINMPLINVAYDSETGLPIAYKFKGFNYEGVLQTVTVTVDGPQYDSET